MALTYNRGQRRSNLFILKAFRVIFYLKTPIRYLRYLCMKIPRMKTFYDLKTRVDELIVLGGSIKRKSIETPEYKMQSDFQGLKYKAISFIERVYGKEHSFYLGLADIFKPLNNGGLGRFNVDNCLGLLGAVKDDIEGGWLDTLKGNIMSEAFVDFLDMGDYFLTEGYKDAAAMMFGGVLEEHLRQLNLSEKLSIFKDDGKKMMGAELNDKLKKNGSYNDIQHSAAVKILKIRNHAAHGEYNEYTKQDIKTMHSDVLNFIMVNSPG